MQVAHEIHGRRGEQHLEFGGGGEDVRRALDLLKNDVAARLVRCAQRATNLQLLSTFGESRSLVILVVHL